MWVELLLALIVETYRELVDWWRTRPRWLAGAPPGRKASLSQRAPKAERPELVADTLAEILDRHGRKHVGLAVGVWWDGETWTQTRGQVRADDLAPLQLDTIFEIGSVTKVFTALLLADMSEEGVVGPDDPVERYLPTGVAPHVRGRPITLLDLASHTSGLPRLPKGLLRLSLRQRSNPYAGFTAAHLERAIAETAPRRPPGKKIAYSNYGFGLLGHALARRAGTTYEQLVRERIGEPLGLENTSIAVSPAARGRFADGHDRRGRPVPHWHLPALAGAGALRSTLADLLRILELHLREPDSRLAVAARSTHKERAQRGGLVQCLGWVSLPLRGSSHRMLWHNGGTGGFRSFVGFVPAAGAGVVVLTNCSRSVDAIGFRVLERLVRDPGNV